MKILYILLTTILQFCVSFELANARGVETKDCDKLLGLIISDSELRATRYSEANDYYEENYFSIENNLLPKLPKSRREIYKEMKDLSEKYRNRRDENLSKFKNECMNVQSPDLNRTEISDIEVK